MTRLSRAIAGAATAFVVGAGAFLVLYVTELGPRDELALSRENDKRLFRFGRIHVLSGRLLTRGATVAFERDERGRFMLTEPVRWPADQDAVEDLLDQMAGLRLQTVLTESATPEERAGWGLDAPKARLDVALEDGRTLSMAVGAKNAIVNRYPVADRSRDGGRVGLADPGFFSAFDRPANGFRDQRIVPLDPAAVRLVAIEGRFSLERGPSGWQVAAPGADPQPADQELARLFVIAFTRRLEASRFVTDEYQGEDAERFGLGEARVRVESEDQRVALQFGQFVESGAEEPLWVVHREDTGTVAEVDGRIENELRMDPDRLVERLLSRFDPDDVRSVEIRLGVEPALTLVRTEKRWPEGILPWRADALVNTFALLTAEATHAEQPTKSERREWLLDPPSRHFIFRGDDGVLADVRIGNLADDQHVLAEAEGNPRVLRVAATKLITLPARTEELRRR